MMKVTGASGRKSNFQTSSHVQCIYCFLVYFHIESPFFTTFCSPAKHQGNLFHVSEYPQFTSSWTLVARSIKVWAKLKGSPFLQRSEQNPWSQTSWLIPDPNPGPSFTALSRLSQWHLTFCFYPEGAIKKPLAMSLSSRYVFNCKRSLVLPEVNRGYLKEYSCRLHPVFARLTFEAQVLISAPVRSCLAGW